MSEILKPSAMAKIRFCERKTIKQKNITTFAFVVRLISKLHITDKKIALKFDIIL